MKRELFVYGSLQPGNMNWDRLASNTLKAERAQVPGYITIIPSGFGALTINKYVPQILAKSSKWDLPKQKAYHISSQKAKMMATGWILELEGDKEFFAYLDAFEGFIPEKGRSFYERKAVWLNGRWVWTYTLPAMDEKMYSHLERVEEWTDSYHRPVKTQTWYATWEEWEKMV